MTKHKLAISSYGTHFVGCVNKHDVHCGLYWVSMDSKCYFGYEEDGEWYYFHVKDDEPLVAIEKTLIDAYNAIGNWKTVFEVLRV